jgi:Asp-tRNA(Asn)/Glu-tRNA(Gln) amidotransferase A subunit family amidase
MIAVSNLPPEFPRLFPRPEQTIAGIGRALREGQTSCVKILEGCLQQVEEWEPKVHAWVILDREKALERARELDDELKAGNDRGRLHGIPIGIKDIIDVVGMPTACGTKRWLHRIAGEDAEIVARLRRAGVVVMGKTVTTPYAWIDPPVTRNPWNLERTPGGSSSGSAAAVACGMCLATIGSQTGGSITRPASFCGVSGMKPTHGLIPTEGVLPLAPSLDHVGPIAKTVDDLRTIFQTIQGIRAQTDSDRAMPQARKRAPRLARLRGYFDRKVESAARSAFDQAIRSLTVSDGLLVDLPDPIDFEQVVKDHRRVMAAEAAATHSYALDAEPDSYPPEITNLIIEGRSLSALAYLNSRNRAAVDRMMIMAALVSGELDALITPATLGPAPAITSTGNPAFNSPWSYTGLPTVSLPIGETADGLPLALQLTGWFQRDAELLEIAHWCEQAIRSAQQ